MSNNKIIILSLGGSLIVPEEIDWRFLRKFKELLEKYIKKGFKFVIITGGGRICRKYQKSLAKISPKLTKEDFDWIGIYVTRLNAHLIRLIFGEKAYKEIATNPNKVRKLAKPVLVAAGWVPGSSTDYDAANLAKRLKIKTIVNLSNIDYVYDKDPKKYKKVKKLTVISWRNFRKIVGDEWHSGMSSPFDPVASKFAQKEKIQVTVINGRDLENLENYLEGKKFKGTIIK